MVGDCQGTVSEVRPDRPDQQPREVAYRREPGQHPILSLESPSCAPHGVVRHLSARRGRSSPKRLNLTSRPQVMKIVDPNSVARESFQKPVEPDSVARALRSRGLKILVKDQAVIASGSIRTGEILNLKNPQTPHPGQQAPFIIHGLD